MILLLLIWLCHLIQVFVPETGFDALWYHLPLADLYLRSGRIVFSPELYQSLNPQFSDLIFLLGYQLARELGTKVVAYIFAQSLLVFAYLIARRFLNQKNSYVAVILISLIQVVAWQSSSYYVDLAKAFWELSSIYLLLFGGLEKNNRSLILSAVLFGASLATKQFSILLAPVYAVLVLIKTNWKFVAFWLLMGFFVASPFYIYSFQNSGLVFYSIDHHLEFLIGAENLLQYFLVKLLTIPVSLIVILQVKDYLNPVLFVFMPLILYGFNRMKIDEKQLVLFSIAQWLIWWFVPPLSTRYSLSGFVVLLILLINRLVIFSKMNTFNKKVYFLIIVMAFVWATVPRLYVSLRSMNYLVGKSTKVEYLQKFLDGNIDSVLKKWYRLP
ncbi:MAG: glycosyltransferase family 39 protein [Patescibacteria group bacterium]